MIFVTRLLRNPTQIADFCAIFLHKTGLLCKVLSVSFTFLAIRREISGLEREIPSPGILFSGLGISFSGLGRKNLGAEFFSRRLRGRFSFPLELFPGHAPRVILPAESPGGLSPGRVSAPGVSRVPSKGRVWRGFRDILIPARRVWLRSFHAVPSRRPNTRISEGENKQMVNAHPKVFILSMEGCTQGAHFLSPYASGFLPRHRICPPAACTRAIFSKQDIRSVS